MKKWILGLAIALLFVSCSFAQDICTPTTISKVPTTHDDGTGPAWQLGVGGNNFSLSYYAPGQSIDVYGTTYIYQKGYAPGYVNVYAGFNGCDTDWSINNVYGNYDVYDNTARQYVYQPGWFNYQYSKHCGLVISCSYNGVGVPGAEVNVIAGHQYQLIYKIYAQTNILNGQTPTYQASLIVNVH